MLLRSLIAIGTAALSVAAGSAVAVAAPATVGGPCGQGGSAASTALSGSGAFSSLHTGSFRDYGMPWLTGEPDGQVPVLLGRTRAREMVTGPGSPNDTVSRFNVSGTDLGIMWTAGDQVLMLFGDTVGVCGQSGDDWRSNVLLRSDDRTLSDGMRITDAAQVSGGQAGQPIKGLLSVAPAGSLEYTVIPTAGVDIGGTQYARFMSVRSWDTPGNWTTNYSGLAKSTDAGEHWTPVVPATRVALDLPLPPELGAVLPSVAPGNTDFQQSAFLSTADWVYEYGTKSGRFGPAKVARFHPADVENLSAYEYWDGSKWGASITDASPVIPGTVSKLSVQWNQYLRKYVAMYTEPLGGLVIRTADQPQGPWSAYTTLVNTVMLPGLYGGFMHPWSDGKYLYFVATTWNRYNVILMRADLTGLTRGPAVVDNPDPQTLLVDTVSPGEPGYEELSTGGQ